MISVCFLINNILNFCKNTLIIFLFHRSSITRLSVDDKAQRSKEVSSQERDLLLHKTIEERKGIFNLLFHYCSFHAKNPISLRHTAIHFRLHTVT